MAKKKISVSEIKVGDKVQFNDGKEKLNVTIKKIDLPKRQIDVTWGRGRRKVDTCLFPKDFTDGHVFK